MKNKGFTLVELLAVIVILAIIALIATPIVLNIIQDTRESATIRSGEFYISAAEQAIMRYNMNKPGEYFNPTECTVTSGNLDCEGVGDIIPVDLDGEKPKDGSIIKFENGKVTNQTTLTFEDGIVTMSEGKLKFSENSNTQIVTCTAPEGVSQGKVVTCGDKNFNILYSGSTYVEMLSSSIIGTTSFATTAFWSNMGLATYEHDYIQSVSINEYLGQTNLNSTLTTYKTDLQNLLGVDSISIRLLNLTDLFNFGCTRQEYNLPSDSVGCGANTIINSLNEGQTSNYWIGSVNNNKVYVMTLFYDAHPNEGYEYSNVAILNNYNSTSGVRPVVTIPRSVIK